MGDKKPQAGIAVSVAILCICNYAEKINSNLHKYMV